MCWTPHGIHIERNNYDSTFFVEICTQLNKKIVQAVLPRILSGTDTEKRIQPSESSGVFCYCRKGESGEMILCDTQSCKYGWFHFACAVPPEGIWFCPDCRD